MKKILCILVMLAFVLMPMITNAATRVDPSRFIISAQPGGRSTGAIKVTNTGQEVAEVSAVIYDWALDETDGLLLFDAGTRPESIQDLIKFNPKRFSLEPGASQMIRFSITAPIDNAAIGEYRGIVFFEQQESQNPEGMGAVIMTQVGATIYLIIESTQKAFRLTDASTRLTDDKVSCIYTVENSGTSHIRYDIAYTVVNESNELVFEGSLPQRVLLPSDSRTLTFPLEFDFKPGKYNLILDFSFQTTDKHLTRTVTFEIAD